MIRWGFVLPSTGEFDDCCRLLVSRSSPLVTAGRGRRRMKCRHRPRQPAPRCTGRRAPRQAPPRARRSRTRPDHPLPPRGLLASVIPPGRRGRESPCVRATLPATSGLSLVVVSAASSSSSPRPLPSTAGGIGRRTTRGRGTALSRPRCSRRRPTEERSRGGGWGGCVPRPTGGAATGVTPACYFGLAARGAAAV